jgi:hypothetical protein
MPHSLPYYLKTCNNLIIHRQRAVIVCFELFHDLTPLASVDMYPDVDFVFFHILHNLNLSIK